MDEWSPFSVLLFGVQFEVTAFSSSAFFSGTTVQTWSGNGCENSGCPVFLIWYSRHSGTLAFPC